MSDFFFFFFFFGGGGAGYPLQTKHSAHLSLKKKKWKAVHRLVNKQTVFGAADISGENATD